MKVSHVHLPCVHTLDIYLFTLCLGYWTNQGCEYHMSFIRVCFFVLFNTCGIYEVVCGWGLAWQITIWYLSTSWKKKKKKSSISVGIHIYLSCMYRYACVYVWGWVVCSAWCEKPYKVLTTRTLCFEKNKKKLEHLDTHFMFCAHFLFARWTSWDRLFFFFSKLHHFKACFKCSVCKKSLSRGKEHVKDVRPKALKKTTFHFHASKTSWSTYPAVRSRVDWHIYSLSRQTPLRAPHSPLYMCIYTSY